jgi:hypothetical protein
LGGSGDGLVEAATEIQLALSVRRRVRAGYVAKVALSNHPINRAGAHLDETDTFGDLVRPVRKWKWK